MFYLLIETLLLFVGSVSTINDGSIMVNCAACSQVTYQVNSWECKVSCDVLSDDGAGINMTAVNDQLQKLKMEMGQLKNAPVYSFSVKKTVSATIDDDPIVYDQVDLNIGGAYDVDTGIFTAPVSGVYFFATHAYASDNGHMFIKQNGAPLCQYWLVSNGYTQSGCNAVANVTAGDAVVVTGDSSNTGVLVANQPAEFSGHIIKQFW